MSVFEKHRENVSYLYFQFYEDGERQTRYLGRSDAVTTWKKAEKLLRKYLNQRLSEFYSKVPIEFRTRLEHYKK